MENGTYGSLKMCFFTENKGFSIATVSLAEEAFTNITQ